MVKAEILFLIAISSALSLAANVRNKESFTKLLLVAGYDGTDLNQVEVIDINSGATCDLPAYPHNVFGLTGSLLNGKLPMVCGGYHCCGSDYKQECYVLKDNAWTPTPMMSDKRLWSSSTFIKTGSGNGFFISGGNHLGVQALSSSEIFVPSNDASEFGSWTPGPGLPKALEEHCMVTLDDGRIFLIGGQDASSTRVAATYFLDVETKLWTNGPDLKMNRDGLGCGLFKDGSTGKTYVVAAGGFDGFKHLNSVEILDLDDPDSWIEGPALPYSLHNGRLVQDPSGGVIFVGGQRGEDYHFSGSLYRLTTVADGWTEMEVKLKNPRNNHAAFLVPDEAVSC